MNNDIDAVASGHADGRRYDIIILGGGCAGLSLVWNLLEAGITQRILVIENREEYRNDRTWCYWQTESTPFDDLADRKWHSWKVIADQNLTATGGSDDYPYLHLRSDRFYQRVLNRIAQAPQVRLLMGTSIISWAEEGEQVTVATSSGEFVAGRVFDSVGITRPRHRVEPRGRWLQHFHGQRICANRPVFTPGQLTLMDHRMSQADGPHFIYLLPYSESMALIENTYFFRAEVDRSRHQQEIAEYLSSHYQLTTADYTVLEEEWGMIPMEGSPGSRRVRTGDRIVPIGITGGAARAATGYAFLRIQRQSREIATRLLDGRKLQRIEASFAWRRYAFFDQVMLAGLGRSPELAGSFFTTLFAGASMESVIRFLTEKSSLRDDWRVVRALLQPKFIRMLLKMVGAGSIATMSRFAFKKSEPAEMPLNFSGKQPCRDLDLTHLRPRHSGYRSRL